MSIELHRDGGRPLAARAGGLMLATLLLGAGAVAGHAAGVRIEGERPEASITVHIEDASVERAIGVLAAKFGFEFVGSAAGKPSSGLSTTVSGTLETILARLLRNRNHSIVRAREAPGGIRRVVLIDGRLGSNLTPAERPGYRKPNAPRRKAARPAPEAAPRPPAAKPE